MNFEGKFYRKDRRGGTESGLDLESKPYIGRARG